MCIIIKFHDYTSLKNNKGIVPCLKSLNRLNHCLYLCLLVSSYLLYFLLRKHYRLG
nr:hypothetical protein CoNPh37_CDS0203 [Staphylococcus phage S-CoN_Ph37]